MVILTAGMGGGTGTGALPYIAKMCKDLEILTVAVVTTPFSFENPNRSDVSRAGIQNLEKCVDTLLVISNDKLLTSNEKIITMSSAFTLADSVLKNSIDTITNIVFNCGTVNLDFNDSCDTNKPSTNDIPIQNTHENVKTSDINNLLAKSKKKENELVIPAFLQSRMKR